MAIFQTHADLPVIFDLGTHRLNLIEKVFVLLVVVLRKVPQGGHCLIEIDLACTRNNLHKCKRGEVEMSMGG